jgi:hypothetical protein
MRFFFGCNGRLILSQPNVNGSTFEYDGTTIIATGALIFWLNNLQSHFHFTSGAFLSETQPKAQRYCFGVTLNLITNTWCGRCCDQRIAIDQLPTGVGAKKGEKIKA